MMNMETLKMTVKYGRSTKEVNVPLPVPGSLGTMYVGTDRYMVVCNSVHSNKRCSVVVIYNINKEKDVTKGDDGYEYLKPEVMDAVLANPTSHGDMLEYSLRKNGTWHVVGQPMMPGCRTVKFGEGDEFRDPEF